MSAGELTTGGFDPKRPDPSGENLTIDQIEERFDVSASTLRRKLRAGEVPGAHKVKTPAGDQWRLPIASVQMIWQERGTADVSPPDTQATGTADLLALADKLVAILEGNRLQLMAAEENRADATARAAAAEARLELTTAELDRERAKTEQLATQLAEQQAKRRGWFRRG